MNDNIHLLTGAYALDALSAEEREEFRVHLDTCEPCRLEVAEYAETAAALGSAVAETPSPGLRGRVMEQVDQTRQERPVAVLQPAAGPSRRWAVPAVAAMAAALVALSVFTGLQWQDNAELEQRVAELEQTVDQQEQLVAGLEQTMAEQTEALEFAASGERVQLDGEIASVEFVFDHDTDQGMLLASDLPPAEQSRTYQLWLFHDEVPVDAGVFAAADDEPLTMFEPAAQVQGAEAVAITVEPEGGVDEPTSDPILFAEL